MRADGVSIREIGKKLNLQQHTVQYLLKKPNNKQDKPESPQVNTKTQDVSPNVEKFAKIGKFTIINLTHGYGLDPFEVQMVLALAIAMNATAMHEVSEEKEK